LNDTSKEDEVGDPAETSVGGMGTNAVGVKLLEEIDDGEVPYELVAVTLNVYATPLVVVITRIGDPFPVAVILPGVLVTV